MKAQRQPKCIFLILIMLFSCLGVYAQTAPSLNQTIYIDFGLNDGSKGEITQSPDSKGNYWNNVTTPNISTDALNLINALNQPSSISFQIVKKFSANGMTGGGGLLTPDAGLLDDFAVKTATEDYFFVEGAAGITGAFKVKNLDPAKAYKFHVFGSRSNTGERTALFTFYGLTMSSGVHQTTGANLGGTGINQNNSTILTSGYIFPDSNGEIVVEVERKTGDYAHINILKLEEYSSVERPAYTLDQKFYFDFGDAARTTANPDDNGNYWNNMTGNTVGATLNLVDNKNTSVSYILEITKKFTLNATSPGALASPSSDLLGDFAIANATVDYFFVEGAAENTGEIKLKNLNPEKGYKFYVFGSRARSSDSDYRIANYAFRGLNTYAGRHQTTGSNIGGADVHQNNSSVFISDMIYPDSNGEIYLEVSRFAGSYAHISCMKMEEYTMPIERATSISISGDDISVSGVASQLTATVLPVNAVYPAILWTVDNGNIAWVDDAGKLYPKGNGTVNVTATIKYDESTVITDTKQFTISNQTNQLYFSGSASENGDGLENAISMRMVTDLDGTITSKYEVYTSLSDGTFGFYTATDGTGIVYGDDGNNAGNIAVNGALIAPSVTGPVRITVDVAANTYTILSLSDLGLTGSALPGGWSTNTTAIPYLGDGVWGGQITLNAGTSSDRARFVILLDKSWTYQIKKIKGSDNSLMMAGQAGEYGIDLIDIYTNLNGGTFDLTIDLRNYAFLIECLDINDKKISVMGSSVANGQGADNMQGYAYMYGQLLKQRFDAGAGGDFQTSNVAINGNNTSNLLERFDADLINDCGGYVIYGLSLGNEGIHDNGLSAFNSYKDNMLLLIEKARNAGITPVVCNNYTRADFTATDYAFVKEMNLLMHEWDVPSINMLGAIDDGAGKWATGYQVTGDIYHPTTAGHAEFFYAMVPSLFDALEAGKPQPQKSGGTSYELGANQSTPKKIELIPENIVHPFTYSFACKTTDTGVIASFTHADATGYLKIDTDGNLVYESPLTGGISSTTVINDENWHRVTLTHYYAQGRTILYIDDQKAGEISEKLVPISFYLSDANAPGSICYSELFFYRSAMSPEEVAALCAGSMLKSSLEIYAPLDGTAASDADILTNLAQSTNTLSLKTIGGGTFIQSGQKLKPSVFPNPVTTVLNVSGLDSQPYSYQIVGLDGRVFQTDTLNREHAEISVSSLPASYYILTLNGQLNAEEYKLNFIKID